MRRGLAATGIAVALLLSVTARAADTPAPYESGKSCVADASAPNRTTIGFDPGKIYPSGLSEVPDWVVTRWKVQVAPGLGPLAQRLVTFQGVSENEDRKTGESALETLSEGTNEFPARLPVTGLHPHAGLEGPGETLYCDEEPSMLAGVVEGQWGTGETRRYKVGIGIGVPLTVTLEPDADGDGYGDLTQDPCPGGSSFGSDCPIKLKVPSTTVRPHAILIEAGPSAAAQLEAFGQVSWRATGGGKRRRGGGRLITVGLSAGAPVPVPAGATTTLRLPLPESLLRHLGKIRAPHALEALLTIRVTDPGGGVTEFPRGVRLRGRMRPRGKR